MVAPTGIDLSEENPLATDEPIYDIAHLGHVELLTPDLQGSTAFFTEVYGLFLEAETTDSIYLRAQHDHDRTTLKLTAAPQPGLGHLGWRTTSPHALTRRVQALHDAGVDGAWINGDIGHGRAFRFRSLGGHLTEIYFESERFVAGPGQAPFLPNQPQRFQPHGAAAARLDHINLLVHDVAAEREFLREVLGFKLRERLVPARQQLELGAWLSVLTKSHDLALTREPTAATGRLHHLAYAVDTPQDVLRAADVFLDNGTHIEFGPAKHSRTQGLFLYVLEPGGNRVEIFTGGLQIYAPDWEAVTWDTESNGRSTAWGLAVPDTFHTYATPPVAVPERPASAAATY